MGYYKQLQIEEQEREWEESQARQSEQDEYDAAFECPEPPAGEDELPPVLNPKNRGHE